MVNGIQAAIYTLFSVDLRKMPPADAAADPQHGTRKNQQIVWLKNLQKPWQVLYSLTKETLES